MAPAIWDAVRHDVDKARGVRGKYILTGSSTPAINKKQATPIHSGAGRIGRIRMYPMSLWESGESTGSVSLSRLFEGEFEPCLAPDDSMQLVELACRGGWPEAMGLDVSDAQLLAREYLRNLFDVSFSKLGLDQDIARRVAMSLSRNLGQAATYKTVIEIEAPPRVFDSRGVRAVKAVGVVWAVGAGQPLAGWHNVLRRRVVASSRFAC